MARIHKISGLHHKYNAKQHQLHVDNDVAIDVENPKPKNKMMNVLLTGGAGATGIEVIGQYPATDSTQQIGQLILQILVAVITIIKLLKDKKTKK